MTEPEFPPAQPSITVHNFSEKLVETSVEFQVTRLQGQTIIWVGSEPRLGSLAAAVPVKDCPSTSLLQAVFSTLIGRASTRLGSHWLRALDCHKMLLRQLSYIRIVGLHSRHGKVLL